MGVDMSLLSDEEIEACAADDDGSDDMVFARAIEALQAEVNAASSAYELANKRADAMEAERDQLQSKLGDAIQSSAHWQHQFTEAQAELDAMGKGEPVGYVGAGYLTLGEGRISEHATDVYKVPVYAAPKALAPLTDDQLMDLHRDAYTNAKAFTTIEVYRYFARVIEAAHGIGGTP